MLVHLSAITLMALAGAGDVAAGAGRGPGGGRIGIFKIAAPDATLGAGAVDALATAVSELKTFDVVTASELGAMVEAQKLQDALGCNDVQCLTEIGQAAGVDRIVSGSIATPAEGLVISLQVLDLRSTRVDNRITVRWRGDRGELPALLAVAVEQLLVRPEGRPPGALILRDGPPGLVTSINEKSYDATTIELPTGIYDLDLSARGYRRDSRQVVIRSGRVTTLDAQLTKDAERSGSGFGLLADAIVPRGGAFHSEHAGFGATGLYWWELPYVAIQPRVSLHLGPETSTEALYVDVGADLGVSYVVLDAFITPIVGVGLGGRYLYTRDPERVTTYGSAVAITRRVSPTESAIGLSGYARAGLLMFRDAPVRVLASVDYAITSFSKENRPQCLVTSLGVVF